ncbi:MAG: hypothetical protein V3T52_07770 [Thermodesulfobacteriota bacterium]|jgi:hypothetical protein
MKFKPLIALILFAILLPLSAFSDDPKSPAEKTKKNTAAQKKNEDQKTPDLDQILANYYKAIGGLDRWQNLDTMIMKGIMDSQGTAMPITAYHERPNKCRVEFILKETMMAQTFNGMFAWQLNPLSGNPDPTPMSQGRSNYLRDTCDIESSLIGYKKKGHKVSLLGEEEIKGKKAYKISVKYRTGNLETHYLSAATYLPIKTEGIYKMDGGEIRTTTNYFDFKNTNGYVVPYNLVFDIHGAPSEEKLIIDTFSFNPKIDTKIFDFPEDKVIDLQKFK